MLNSSDGVGVHPSGHIFSTTHNPHPLAPHHNPGAEILSNLRKPRPHLLSLSASGIPQRHIIPRSVLSTLCQSPIRLLFELNHVPARPHLPTAMDLITRFVFFQQHDEGSTTKYLSTYPPCFLAPTLVQACLPNRLTEQDERYPELHFDFLLEATTLGREGFVLLYRWIRKRSRIMARMKAAWGQRVDIVFKVQRKVGGVGSYGTVGRVGVHS